MKNIFCIVITGLLVLVGRPAFAYNGGLDYVVCDIKRPLAGLTHKTITAGNYQAIIDGLKNKLQCNALRLYIDLAVASPDHYSELYKNVYRYARQMGLKIYANPLGTGRQGLGNAELARIVANYANYYQPEFLGPFNETGIGIPDLQGIAAMVRRELRYATILVGPDTQKVQGTINKINGSSNLEAYFDIIGAHNAEQDEQATVAAWRILAGEARRPVWASENPRSWTAKNDRGEEIGVASVIGAGSSVSGLVIYLAFPVAIDENGNLTQQGQELVYGIGAIE